MTKVFFRCEDGALTETVFSQTRGACGLNNTVCVSSQIGCRRTCGHCSSGLLNFGRDLTTGEIVSQVAAFAVDHEISQVVFQGMGEPLDNPAVCGAASFLASSFDKLTCSCDGVECGTVHTSASPSICLSTVGNSNAMLDLATCAPHTRLMLSVMPDVERLEPLEALLECTDEFVQRTGSDVALSYTMIDGLDTDSHVETLLQHMRGRSETHVVQLVQFHDSVASCDKQVRASQPASIRRCLAKLREGGCRVGFGQYCEFPTELRA